MRLLTYFTDVRMFVGLDLKDQKMQFLVLILIDFPLVGCRSYSWPWWVWRC